MSRRYGDDADKIMFYLEVFRNKYFYENTDTLDLERRIFTFIAAITEKPLYSDPFVEGYRRIIYRINFYKSLADDPTILNENFKAALDRLYNSILDPWRIKFFAQLNFHAELDNLEQEFLTMISSEKKTFDSWIRDYRVMFSAALIAEHVNPLRSDQGETVIQHIASIWNRLHQVPVSRREEEAKERVLLALNFMAAEFRQNMADPIVLNMPQKWWEVPP